MYEDILTEGSVAVVTGGAAGIGLAAAKTFAERGLSVCIADLGADRLAAAAEQLAAVAPKGNGAVMTSATDVSQRSQLEALEAAVQDRFGGTDILMNNAGIQTGSALFGPVENWERVFSVNLWGVIHGTQVFVPKMLDRGRPGLVVNTGSKQGITTPPGDPAYNVAKAGVKVFTEALAHELRGTGKPLSAHLLIPGFVFTELTSRGRADKPDGAWTSEQTVAFMFERLAEGDFYILCPDNDVSRAVDERRISWAAADIVENRSALSRWDPKYSDAFAKYMAAP
ncbi:MAG: SDR family NAD(P)-dependent oxidoreductase [Pseudomonadota bacterium]